MALMELAECKGFDCSELVVCLPRSMEADQQQGLVRDLGWVGFDLSTLAQWCGGNPIISKDWLFLSVDI
jgi:hypothetical protein